ncbi:MAG TPA: hypothetical protein H9889_10380, partial [Candidatus Ignatzschineria merdigallinarum]|nr:hypothetical protein [Candidatus Ignatzschineria merdigallinarum]
NGAWRFLPLPDRAKHKQKKARNYAGLAAFHAIRCLAVPDAESFPSVILPFLIPFKNGRITLGLFPFGILISI